MHVGNIRNNQQKTSGRRDKGNPQPKQCFLGQVSRKRIARSSRPNLNGLQRFFARDIT